MDNLGNLITFGAGLITILALIFSNRAEGFEVASIGSMPTNNLSPESGLSLFLNLYPRFGQDFKLFDFIQKLKLNNSDPIWNGVYKNGNNTNRNLFNSKKLVPIILVPGLGASQLYARWNTSDSKYIKSVDESGKFQKDDSWACKQVQDSWVPIWPPDSDGLASYCWGDNVKVTTDGKMMINANGVNTTSQEFGSLDFATDDYMDTLITALEAIGYIKGENLFGACYDFRKIGSPDEIDAWCLSLTKLIEKNCAIQENPAIIIGHDLGAMVANYFLVGALKEWKDNYIKSFISVSGTFGGCPKALRAVLSGISAPGDALNFSRAVRNFSGLHLMLPNPKIYGDNPLVHFNQMSYTSYDIPKLVSSVSDEAAKVSAFIEPVRDKMMKAPGVTVYMLAGDDLNTESSYKYNMSLVNTPQRNAPFYQLELPFNQKFNYPDYFVGDGTMPRFALEYPIFWTKSQKEPVYFQFFQGQEHTKILSSYEPVKYILSLI